MNYSSIKIMPALYSIRKLLKKLINLNYLLWVQFKSFTWSCKKVLKFCKNCLPFTNFHNMDLINFYAIFWVGPFSIFINSTFFCKILHTRERSVLSRAIPIRISIMYLIYYGHINECNKNRNSVNFLFYVHIRRFNV